MKYVPGASFPDFGKMEPEARLEWARGLENGLRRAAANALHAQSACNLPAIVRTMAQDLAVLCDLSNLPEFKGIRDSNWRNRHPVCRLYAEQVAWLSGAGCCTDSSSYSEATKACERLAEAPAMFVDPFGRATNQSPLLFGQVGLDHAGVPTLKGWLAGLELPTFDAKTGAQTA